MAISSGVELWSRAKAIIPGGNMLLSKRPEMFLPGYWPSYFSSASGCDVWDLDGTRYSDMSLMGVGTNVLGYGHPEVDNAVKKVVDNGNMSSLNCPEEVYLAEKLISLHPWAHMVRLARTGGEANAIAVRIARAASGRDKIAICGYHGWHDWYLATNIQSSDNLSEHLLPGLSPSGVPKSLKGSVIPFRYNNIQQLKEIIAHNSLAAIKMEVQRSCPPDPGYLESVRQLCNDHNIILIFDECTSGFRETYGGLHLKYAVNPDIAIFGKTLGNGYAITSIIGTASVMEYAQSTFISSTFWTERIGPSAALTTLDVMKKTLCWKVISQKGAFVKNIWIKLSQDYDIPITIGGLDALATFTFDHPQHLDIKTFMTKSMLDKGFLATTAFYASLAHSDTVFSSYSSALADTFKSIKSRITDDGTFDCTGVDRCHSGFVRLN